MANERRTQTGCGLIRSCFDLSPGPSPQARGDQLDRLNELYNQWCNSKISVRCFIILRAKIGSVGAWHAMPSSEFHGYRATGGRAILEGMARHAPTRISLKYTTCTIGYTMLLAWTIQRVASLPIIPPQILDLHHWLPEKRRKAPCFNNGDIRRKTCKTIS